MSDQPPQNEAFVTFSRYVDHSSVDSLIKSLGSASVNGVTHVHLLLQSGGGVVGDGVCLYNFFRNLPFKLTVYNMGSVASVAVIAYLGAHERKVSASASFMIHRTRMKQEFATSTRLESLAHGVRLDDERTEAILRAHLTISEKEWQSLRDDNDILLPAKDAVKCGLAHEIADFSPPAGTRLYCI